MANNKRWIVRLAQEEHDGKLLIRDDAEVRQEQGGCYVAAWVWVENAYIVDEPEFGVWGPVANNEAKWILDAEGRIARFPTEATAQVCADEYSVINNLLGTPNAFRVEQLREG